MLPPEKDIVSWIDKLKKSGRHLTGAGGLPSPDRSCQ
jgi:hypothetical protein